MNKIICYYIFKIRFKALAFSYLLPLTSMKIIYISLWSSDHFRKLTIFDHKYKIPLEVSREDAALMGMDNMIVEVVVEDWE